MTQRGSEGLSSLDLFSVFVTSKCKNTLIESAFAHIYFCILKRVCPVVGLDCILTPIQFRGIALLNVEGKIFFSVMAKRMTNFLLANNYVAFPAFPAAWSTQL